LKNLLNVVHLTSVHPAFDIRIFHKECQSLAQAGYNVTLIVPHDRDEIIGDVRIRAIPVPRGRIQRFLKTIWQIYREAVRADADVYHFHDPELIIIGLLLRAGRKKVIYDVHENVPRDILDRDYLPYFLLLPIAKLTAVLELLCGLFLDCIITVTHGIAKRFPENKTVLVENFPIIEEFSQNTNTAFRDRSETVVYAGSISVLRGVFEMVKAVDILSRKRAVELAMAGIYSPAGLDIEIKRLAGWGCTRYLGWLNRSQVSALFSNVRAGLILFHPTPNHMDSVTNKMFEYMAAGLPLIASDFPKWREIINDVGCGILVNPLNPAEIANAIDWMMSNPDDAELMGRAGRRAVLNKYNWNNEKAKLLNAYQMLSNERP